MSVGTGLANRHIARLLGKIEEVLELPAVVKTEIMQEMHWLAEDVEKAVSER